MASDDVVLPGTEVVLFDDKAAVAQAAADTILAAADAAIARHGRFRLCLAGGTTPTAAYALLADADADWSRWWIYHGDERCLPITDPERNSLAADQVWLNRVPVLPGQVFAIPAELGAEAAADAYEPLVAAALPFDLVLLGMGEDGHTASLFPGRKVPADRLAMPVHEAPKPPPDRVSLTTRALSQSEQLLILVTGSGKADAIRGWSAGEPLPVAQVATAAQSRVLVDRAAAAGLI
ncbi:6-phosphogluconolactonase [Halochromatium roseum]|uniref:6-phosphogluconolactonase n=1 Tax=Halochromatium roseum TaxID=391920 RepID=UPI0019127E3E|nr:6-phosphogluconolactonase [Halochromatium roseum]MBK5940843.1 6-phosphogluconolactonase [Halochromatium roseum]